MWRSFSSVEARPAAATLLLPSAFVMVGCVLAACAMAGCGTTQREFAMRQPIEMGPWTFEVQSATERRESSGGQQIKMVSIELKLHNYRERHAKPFDEFLNGHSPGSIMAFPNMKLEDEAGTRFDGWLVPLSGGNLRSETWRAEFPLVPSSAPDDNTAERAAMYLDTRLPDLRVVIDNPDRRGDQPDSVAVRLR